jgi:hypothetical protein
MVYGLPTSLQVGGENLEIRSDFRVVLDIFEVLNDVELDAIEKSVAALMIFYPAFQDISLEDYQEALEKCFWFINGGQDETPQKGHKLMDWQQDFPLIIAPVNRALGFEAREPGRYLHWWTFLAAFKEIGDCLFAQVVHIRDKKARGKTLDKAEQEFYRRNSDLVDLRTKYSTAEEELFRAWT